MRQSASVCSDMFQVLSEESAEEVQSHLDLSTIGKTMWKLFRKSPESKVAMGVQDPKNVLVFANNKSQRTWKPSFASAPSSVYQQIGPHHKGL